MYSNYRRQGNFNARHQTRQLVQKPVQQSVKPMQILKRPDQVSLGDKVSLPTLPNMKLKEKANHVINSCTKPVIEISPVVPLEATKSSRRKPRSKDSKSSPALSKPSSSAYHSDSPNSQPPPSFKSRSKSSRPAKTSPVDHKEAAAVNLLMVLLNSEVKEPNLALSASTPPKKTSKPRSPPRARDDQVISPLSLLELLQPTPPSVKSSSKPAYNDNYYAAPQFRKPPRLSELPVPPFLTV